MDLLTERKLKNINLVFQVVTPLVTLITISLATYITIRLAPLYQNIDSLVYRVQAIEDDRKSVPEWRSKTAILEQKVNEDHETILEIKSDVKDIRNDMKELTKFLYVK